MGPSCRFSSPAPCQPRRAGARAVLLMRGMKPSRSAVTETTPATPPASDQRPNARACLRQALACMDLDALGEAGELYGGDVNRELEDIKAGRHPLQRGGRDLDAYD